MILDHAVQLHPSTALVFRSALRAGGSCEVFDRLDAVDPSHWQTLFAHGWKDERYYRTLEETFSGQFTQFYLVLRDRSGKPRALQPCFLVEQDLTVSLPRPVRTCLQLFGPRLRARLLMVGCIVGEGHVGVRDKGELSRVCVHLDEALTLFARHAGIKIIVFKDFPPVYRPSLDGRNGYTRLPGLPGVQLALDFDNFEGYLQNRLGKSTRKSLRRKFREADGLQDPVRLEVKTRITPSEATVLHRLYEQVARRSHMPFEVFGPAYFLRLAERMPDQARYFIWKRQEQAVAFSFCMVHGDTIYDNDLGMDDALARPLHLYYVTFRDLIRWSLAQGLKHYQSSPFNYASKLRLGMSLLPLDLYVKHLSPLANTFLHRFAPLAAPARREPLLRQFPAAAELL